MIIRAAQIKSARRYARLLGEQVAHEDDEFMRSALESAWNAFITQFGDVTKEPDLQVVITHITCAYTDGQVGLQSDDD